MCYICSPLVDFMKKYLLVFSFALFLLLNSSCEYKKLLKSADYDKKYEMAIQYYEKKDYVKAEALLEELITIFRATDKAESVYFHYAYTNYQLGYYTLASYYFQNFANTYPNSTHTEECAYMSAYCYNITSPDYSLDQSDTKIAIGKMQEFINRYPTSERVEEANRIMDQLRGKLEKKAIEIAKQYYKTGHYKSSIVAFNNIMKDFPDTPYREEATFMVIKSNYMLLLNSIESKKAERIDKTIDCYLKFIDKYPTSTYLRNAETIYKATLELKNKNKTKSST